MAKNKYLFETTGPNVRLHIALDRSKGRESPVGDLEFIPGDVRPNGKGEHDTFGEADVASEHVRARLNGMEPDQIVEEIKRSDSYKRRKPGLNGIWHRDERTSQEVKAIESAADQRSYMHLTEDELRGMIANRGGAYQVGATKEQLVAVLVDLISGVAPVAQKRPSGRGKKAAAVVVEPPPPAVE